GGGTAAAAGDQDDGGRAGQDTATCRASLADAMVEMAGAYLSGKIAAAGNPDLYQVIVHVGPEALLDGPDPATALAATPGPPDVSAETSGGVSVGAADCVPAPTAAPSGAASDAVPGRVGVSAGTSSGISAGPAAEEAECRVIGHPANLRRCHIEDGPALSAAAARALACRVTVTWMLHDHDGTLLDVGRRHRRATAALRRAVRERDR